MRGQMSLQHSDPCQHCMIVHLRKLQYAQVLPSQVTKQNAATFHTDSSRVQERGPLRDPATGRVGKPSSRYRGVRWHERNAKWEACIFDGVKQVSLGYYVDEQEAARAYDRLAIQVPPQAFIGLQD